MDSLLRWNDQNPDPRGMQYYYARKRVDIVQFF